MRLFLVLLAAATAAVSLAAAAGGAAKPVAAKLVEFKILPTVKTTTAGKVTFVVRNAGKLNHEFVVIKTTKPAGKLAASGAAEANEKGAVGETKELAPGKSQTLTLTLQKGHYAIICNLPGHYKAGQFTDFTVR